MSNNGLEFNISAKDQASAAMQSVQRKINDFGKDVAKSVLAIAGPIALVSTAISMIGDAIEDYKKKIKDAIDYGAGLKESANGIGVGVEEYQKLAGAAEQAGVSIDKVAKAYTEINKLIEQAKDPASAQADALARLGFAAEEIAKGNIKAIDVIERMGAALSTTTSETDKMKIATGLLGDVLAKELLPALKEGIELKKGFVDTEGLTDEEAQLLREQALEERRKTNREKVAKAKELAAEKMKTDPKVKAELSQMFPDLTEKEATDRFGYEYGAAERAGYSRVMHYQDGRRIADTYEKRKYTDEETRQAAANIKEKERLEKERAAKEAQTAAQAQAAALKQKADQDAKRIADEKHNKEADEQTQRALEKAEKERLEEKDKKEKEAKKKDDEERKAIGDALDAEAKASKETKKLTVSSLREVGGAIAGEAMTSGVDYAAATLDVQQRMLLELQKMNTLALPTTVDFTKETTPQTNTFA